MWNEKSLSHYCKWNGRDLSVTELFYHKTDLFALNSAFFHKTYKHNCKLALTTCVYMYLTVKTVCVCALLNRDLCKQRAEIFPRCWSVLSMGTAHSQSRTPYVVPPSNTLQGLIPSFSVTQIHKNIVSLTEASVLLLAMRRLWSP